MGNRNKAKGTTFETIVLKFLRALFSRVYRPATKGKYDTGDINGVQHPVTLRQVIFQCKNQRKFNLGEWMVATKEQASQPEVGGDAVPVLVVKRPGFGESNIGKSYAIMELSDLTSLIHEAGYR